MQLSEVNLPNGVVFSGQIASERIVNPELGRAERPLHSWREIPFDPLNETHCGKLMWHTDLTYFVGNQS